MRVAHLTTMDLALRYLLLPQIQAVLQEGGEVIGISGRSDCVEELEAVGVRHVALKSSTRGANLRADLRAARELWNVLRKEPIDILHTHNPKPGLYGRILGRLAGVPIVINTVHGLYATEDDRLRKRALVYGLEAIASRFSDAELVQSEEDLHRMRRLRICRRSKARLLGNGIDLRRFDPSQTTEEERRRIRASLGIPNGRIVIGMVGRLVAEKGYPELFEAAKLLDRRYVVITCGHADPDKPDALSADAIAAAKTRGVRFLGMRQDMERIYRAMDIFVLPSHREGVPRAAMEAAAMGLPIVATNIRGCREVVRDGINGILVPVGDPNSLARAIQNLGANRSLRRELGNSGYRIAREQFDEREIVRTVLETYREVAARKGVALGVPTDAAPGKRGHDEKPVRNRVAAAVKRSVDIVLSSVLLVGLLPVLIAVAVAVAIGIDRRVLFVQERGGRGGRPFKLYKFRTMRDLRDANGAHLPDGQRITRLGGFLRSASLDELPSLINVLKGNMSLVGPRPLIADYLPLYTQLQARRHEVRPGITGWVQVNGRNDLSWDDKFALDVWYVEHRSLWLDLKILARTLWNVVARRGISQEGHATMPLFTGNGRPETRVVAAMREEVPQGARSAQESIADCE